ncbi:MAG: hypothetical protein RIQ41_98 [Candidatus Parcubacteria bacterium]|jgi:hypothetical protein
MKQIVTSALYLFTLFVVSKYVFDPANLYYELKWLDIPMHIMGGFGVASLTSAILSYRGIRISFTKLLIAYTVVALLWEVYEYVQDLSSYQDWNGWIDTVADYINGLVGTLVAYLLLRK